MIARPVSQVANLLAACIRSLILPGILCWFLAATSTSFAAGPPRPTRPRANSLPARPRSSSLPARPRANSLPARPRSSSLPARPRANSLSARSLSGSLSGRPRPTATTPRQRSQGNPDQRGNFGSAAADPARLQRTGRQGNDSGVKATQSRTQKFTFATLPTRPFRRPPLPPQAVVSAVPLSRLQSGTGRTLSEGRLRPSRQSQFPRAGSQLRQSTSASNQGTSFARRVRGLFSGK